MSQIYELYEFQRKDSGMIYRYTSSQNVISYGGNNYGPIPLQRSSVEIQADEPTNIMIHVDRNNLIALLFRHVPPSYAVTVKIIQYKSPTSATPIWHGVINSVNWDSTGASLDCVDILNYENKLTTPQSYSKSCRHMLYGDQCGVSKSAHRGTIDIQSVNVEKREIVFTIVTSGFTNLMCVGGIFLSNELEILSIDTGTGTPASPIRAKLSGNPSELPLGHNPLRKGCNRTWNACFTRFDNLENFGGFISIPSKTFADRIIGD